MKSREESNSCDFWTKLVYLLVGLVFVLSILPLGRMKENFLATSREAAAVTEVEKEEAKQIFLQIKETTELKGKEYGPEDFFSDRAVIVPLRDKFERLVGFERDFRMLQGIFNGILEGLFKQAQNNFPWASAPVSRNSVMLSQKDRLKNHWRWKQAETNAPIPQGHEPISISFKGVLSFGKWLLWSYLKFLPCSFLLILFHILRRRRSVWQELILRPRFFLCNVLKGPVGVAVYNGVDPAFEWRYAKARTRYMWDNKKHSLSETEENAIWLQAREPLLTFNQALQRVKEMPDLIVRRSKFAVIVSYLMMITLTPVLAMSGGFNQKPTEQVNVQSDGIFSETEEEDASVEKQKSGHQVVTVEAVIHCRIQLFQSTASVVRVEPDQQIVNCWVSGRWFLPPSLAPPLSRR